MILRVLQVLMVLMSLMVFAGGAAAQRYSRSPPLFQPWAAPLPEESGGLRRAYRDRERAERPQRIAPSRPSAMSLETAPEVGQVRGLPPHLQRQQVNYLTSEPVGTIVVDTANTYLYLVLGSGKALRYGIGVGREGFAWAGRERISRMAEWPEWHPPKEMIERQPDLPYFMPGGLSNPLGARALYLGKTLYRIHGTNEPSSIGTFSTSGCIRLRNQDIMDLYQRVTVGAQVVVLPGNRPL